MKYTNKMDARSALLRPLPNEVSTGIQRAGPPLTFSNFSEWLKLEREETDVSRQMVFLDIRRQKKPGPPAIHKKKKLSRIDRKKLGLYSLSKKELTYQQMQTVHNLWVSYMTQLLNVNQLEKSGWNNNPQHPQFEQVNMRLYRADYHGAHLTVIKSCCPSLVGCSGLVVMDTKNCFKLVGEDGVTRTIPKKSCQFELPLERLKFTFHGHNFIVRPADRSNKKIKNIKPQSL